MRSDHVALGFTQAGLENSLFLLKNCLIAIVITWEHDFQRTLSLSPHKLSFQRRGEKGIQILE